MHPIHLPPQLSVILLLYLQFQKPLFSGNPDFDQCEVARVFGVDEEVEEVVEETVWLEGAGGSVVAVSGFPVGD